MSKSNIRNRYTKQLLWNTFKLLFRSLNNEFLSQCCKNVIEGVYASSDASKKRILFFMRQHMFINTSQLCMFVFVLTHQSPLIVAFLYCLYLRDANAILLTKQKISSFIVCHKHIRFLLSRYMFYSTIMRTIKYAKNKFQVLLFLRFYASTFRYFITLHFQKIISKCYTIEFQQ